MLWFWMFLTGLGIGPAFSVLTIVVQSVVPFEHLGVATGNLTFFRQIGGSVGLAIVGTLFANGFKDHLVPAAASRPACRPETADGPGGARAASAGSPRSARASDTVVGLVPASCSRSGPGPEWHLPGILDGHRQRLLAGRRRGRHRARRSSSWHSPRSRCAAWVPRPSRSLSPSRRGSSPPPTDGDPQAPANARVPRGARACACVASRTNSRPTGVLRSDRVGTSPNPPCRQQRPRRIPDR